MDTTRILLLIWAVESAVFCGLLFYLDKIVKK